MKALAASHNYPPIGFPERRINEICRYRLNFGPIMEDIVSNMNKELKTYGYVSFVGVRTSYGALVKIIQDKASSYPVIALSHKYLDDRCGPAEVLDIPNPPDHVVIVLASDSLQTTIFDSFDTRSKTMQSKPDRIGKGLYLMSTGLITDYWEKAFGASWMFWITKKGKETTKTTVLEQYAQEAK
jgi:hypothetical protein